MNNEFENRIGSKIALLRESRSISVEEMAERSGLDLAYYKLLEENKEVPTIGDLIKVVRVLGIRLGMLLDDYQDDGPVICRDGESAHEAVNRSKGDCSGIFYRSLSSRKGNRHMETYSLEIGPADGGEKEMSNHEGEEFLYVLEGEVEITYGKESYLLKKGDSIYYDSIVSHNISSASMEKGAKLLAIIYIAI